MRLHIQSTARTLTINKMDLSLIENAPNAGRLRERFPILFSVMNEGEGDALAHLAFPMEYWQQLYST